MALRFLWTLRWRAKSHFSDRLRTSSPRAMPTAASRFVGRGGGECLRFVRSTGIMPPRRRRRGAVSRASFSSRSLWIVCWRRSSRRSMRATTSSSSSPPSRLASENFFFRTNAGYRGGGSRYVFVPQRGFDGALVSVRRPADDARALDMRRSVRGDAGDSSAAARRASS